MIKTAQQVAEKLSALLILKPTDEISLRDWYRQAQVFADFVKARPEVSDLIPIRVWQFLSDADIRMKDQLFAQGQERMLRKFISGLNRGVFLHENSIDSEPDTVFESL
jgi:hypothetical protein